MLQQILADAGAVVNHRNIERPKALCIADPGALQQLRGHESARGEYHLAVCPVFDGCAIAMSGYTDRLLAFEEHPVDGHAGLDPQIAPRSGRSEKCVGGALPAAFIDGTTRIAHP